VKACFLVYAQVAAWRSVTLQTEIAEEETLENYFLNIGTRHRRHSTLSVSDQRRT
jgi:hypothetical protein